MNFYTSTSKKLKYSILIFFLSGISTMVIFDLLLAYYASTKTTKTSFITEKESKIKHCQLNSPINKDAIFIGSSRTFYHVSTNEFNKNGISIYNLGVSNNSLQDYGSFIEEAIKYKPKTIIISVEVNELFRPLPLSQYPIFNDLKAYSQVMNTPYQLHSISNWIQNFHSLLRHSETIYLKIDSIYKQYNIKKIDKNNTETNNTFIDYNKRSDCDIFSTTHIKSTFITSKCKNGDGILFGKDLEKSKVKIVNLEKLNQETINFLNYLITKIKDNSVTPIIILEPVSQFYTNNNYDFNNIQKSIHGNTIDLTNLHTRKEMWIDSRHFNNTGRLFYSKHLSKILQGIIHE